MSTPQRAETTGDQANAAATETGDGKIPDEQIRPSLPAASSTSRREAAVWWVVFAGPAVVTAALVVAGTIGDSGAAAVAFAVGVWAFTLTLGIAAAPRSANGLWWVPALAISFVAAGVAFGLLYAISGLSDRIEP